MRPALLYLLNKQTDDGTAPHAFRAGPPAAGRGPTEGAPAPVYFHFKPCFPCFLGGPAATSYDPHAVGSAGRLAPRHRPSRSAQGPGYPRGSIGFVLPKTGVGPATGAAQRTALAITCMTRGW